jgi:cation:H+ antiporter
VRALKVLRLIHDAGAAATSALSALWTFPSILFSAFLVAWGAEAAQFLMSQGLALAILAWLQTLPEFAVEVVIAWEAGKDPARAHLAIANLTGAIRLLLGLGWPMIYAVSAWYGRGRGERLPAIRLAHEHATEVVGLIPGLLYFVVILMKGTIGWIDAVILLALYGLYLAALLRHPPQSVEQIDDAPAVSRWAYRLPGWRRPAAITGLFVVGGVLLFVTAHPFLESMLALAGTFGVSQFVLVQWVAPFLSEFPEKLSAFAWARRVTHAPMALMNLVSSNINQWTVLAPVIPLVYGYSHWRATGSWTAFHFDDEQRLEILITLLQSAVAVLVLLTLEFQWFEAAGIFVLWLVQFVAPHLRIEVAWGYAGWMVLLLGSYAVGRRKPVALGIVAKSLSR